MLRETYQNLECLGYTCCSHNCNYHIGISAYYSREQQFTNSRLVVTDHCFLRSRPWFRVQIWFKKTIYVLSYLSKVVWALPKINLRIFFRFWFIWNRAASWNKEIEEAKKENINSFAKFDKHFGKYHQVGWGWPKKFWIGFV